ncbi:hypothetical protein JCM19037_2345 [Geomicrobium sp. JCM 19037]|uniref:DUF6612 family protein n=1 Tax=Geomicrobium sp. JCM 19037 TaxID=1460634 RepID=UPI00045F11B4|nr:DUF6612 family protein [Geomicrobium sp. JCM 19037]GAK03977.1 hypothetical protein JCM19037_2345 [Geomicrobium sp. JCM 19037]
MKKMNMLLSTSALMLVLAACGDEDTETDADVNEEATQEEETDAEPVEDEEVDTETSDSSEAEEILMQSMEAMEQVNSFRSEMDMDQTISFDGEDMVMDSSAVMEVIVDPMMFSQTMTMPDPMSEEEMEMEQYMDEDGTLYMYDEMSGEWLKMSGEMMGMENLEDFQMAPQDQLEMLLEYANELSVEDEGDRYALTIEGSGDDLMELTRELTQMQQGDQQMAAEMDQIFQQMDINVFDYVIYINKDTYYQEEMTMNLEMEIEEEGETMTMVQETHATFYDFDEVESIEIPQEALDNAIDMGEIEQEMPEFDEDIEDDELDVDEEDTDSDE